MTAGRCPHCARAVIWCRTAAGKNIPLDPRTDPHGVYVPLKGRAWLPSELAAPRLTRALSPASLTCTWAFA